MLSHRDSNSHVCARSESKWRRVGSPDFSLTRRNVTELFQRACLLGTVSSERQKGILTGSEEACREDVITTCIGHFLPLLTRFETY